MSGIECTRSNDDSLAGDEQKTACVKVGLVGGSKHFGKVLVSRSGRSIIAGGLRVLRQVQVRS